MSGVAQARPPAAPPLAPPARAQLGDAELRALALRAIVFAALAGYAAAHWTALVAGAPAGRVAGVVGVCTLGGVLMSLAGRAAGGRMLVAGASAAVLTVLTIWLSFLAIGLPGEMLPPGGWDELGDLVDSGLAGLQTVDWPYSGSDSDVRLTLLLAIPAAIAPAAALAFWPDERLQPVLRTQALVLLLVLYGVGATEAGLSAPFIDGLMLLVLIAAWLWLPGLQPGQTRPAAVAVAVAGLIALPVASGLDGERPWIDYEQWRWGGAAAGTQTFDWNHSYGPIDWPREGNTVLEVRAPRAHYWKAQTLATFDGYRWHGEISELTTRSSPDVPPRFVPGWNETLEFTVRDMKSDFVVGAGTISDVDVPGALALTRVDGTARMVNGPLEEGDTYRVRAYVPDPTADQMRAAPQDYEGRYRESTYLALPERGSQRSDAGPRRVVSVGLRGETPYYAAEAVRRIRATPYRRMYRLATRLVAGQPTVYDAVKRVEAHLQDNYRYDESPPERDLPLHSFLFEDRMGYCQQFSGAMALMLRMNGIPARVAAGFSPGFRTRGGRYIVRDTDAHSWVEVYFPGIGWVPFDPTPALAPAVSQSGGPDATSAARGGAADPPTDAGRSQRAERAQPVAAGEDDGFRLGLWVLPALLLAVGLAATAVLLLRERRRALAAERRGEPALDELRKALQRLGYQVPPGTTLLALERRLGAVAGPGASRYVRILRERRFAPPGPRSAGGLDRRALRRALARPLGRTGRLRGLLALPPRPFGRPL